MEKIDNLPEKFCVDSKDMLIALRELQYLIGSLRRIGDYSIDDKCVEYRKETLNFVIEESLVDRLVNIRSRIEKEAELLDYVGDEHPLEICFKDIEYWHPSNKTPKFQSQK